MIRIRWAAVLFGLGQVLTYYRPYPSRVLAIALGLTGALAAGNALLWSTGRSQASLRTLRLRAVLAVALDMTVILGFAFAYSFDGASAIWILLYIIPLEGAILFRFPGAMLSMAAAAAGYTGREIYASAVYHVPLVPSSLSFRMGVGFLIAAVAGAMASSLVKERDRLVEVNELLEVEIADRVRAERALEQSRSQLVDAQRIASIGSWEWDVATNEVRWSDELYRLFGITQDKFPSTFEGYLGLVHPEDRPAVAHVVGRSVETLDPFEFDHRVLLSNGSVRWLHCTGQIVGDGEGSAVSMVGTAQDVTARRRAEDALAHQAAHDPLTGLPNRTLFLDRLAQVLSRRRREPLPSAVFFIDLDRFKALNDTLGHAAGDRLLVEVARRLEIALRPGDTVARFGGDEFVVLCEGVATDDAIAIVGRAMDVVSSPFELDSIDVVPQMSVGIAIASPGGRETAETILGRADAAMYLAKEKGRARFEVFSPGMSLSSHVELRDEAALRRAIDANELVVHYQPELDLASLTVVGVEALVRWNHPTLGLVPPGEFIPLAEETGLIVPLGMAVLREACREVARWRAYGAGDLSLSVNLSARQLTGPALAEAVSAALVESGLPPSTLRLEITESVLLDGSESHLEALRTLHRLGVHIVVDDFGTGYSSLTYLKRFPVTMLKIDRSFVEGLGRDKNDDAIVAGVIQLAHAFDATTIAEGVETEVQLRELRALGCESGQGFLWSHALPGDELLEWIRATHDGRSAGPAPDLSVTGPDLSVSGPDLRVAEPA